MDRAIPKGKVQVPEHRLTFAPLQPHWTLPTNIDLPFYLSKHLSICSIPEWTKIDNAGVKFLAGSGENLGSNEQYCLAAEYETESLSSSDCSKAPNPSRSNELTKTDKIRFANLALWIACQEQECTLADLEKGRMLYQGLERIERDGTLCLSGWATMRALGERDWTFRFLNLWIALECLFGPRDLRDSNLRLAQRVAFFLESDPAKIRALYENVKDSYSWRSKVVHGLRLAKLNEEKSRTLLIDMEQLVRRLLLKILENDSMTMIFAGGERETYLDGLAIVRC